MEKIDGSLIKVYYWGGLWRISTRGTAFAESEVNGFGITFRDLVLKALGMKNFEEFQRFCHTARLDSDYTYIFEITAPENRVVKKYGDYTLWFLAARNKGGNYGEDLQREKATLLGAKIPQTFSFDTVDSILEAAKKLDNLDEGYVLYQGGKPILKIKSPLYVVAHRIRGEGLLSPKRIAQLILMNEHAEYLTYFPEDKKMFEPFLAALDSMLSEIETVWVTSRHIDSQKDFALSVKYSPYSSVLFTARKEGVGPKKAFTSLRESHKVDLLLDYENRIRTPTGLARSEAAL